MGESPLSNADCDEIIGDLDSTARGVDRHEYGLPTFDEAARLQMRRDIRLVVDRALARREAQSKEA